MFHLTTCIIVLLTAIKCNHDIQLYPRATTSIICLCICNEGNFISRTKSIKNRPLRPGCTNIMLMMLMMCGDVESNSGPITMDHSGTCRKVVKTGDKALGCEYCNTWFHTHFENYSNAESSSSSLGSRRVPWLGEGLSMSSPNDPVLCCPLPYRVAPVFVQVVSPPLGWSPLTYFLVIWSPSGDARGPSVVFQAVDMPCPGPFHFSHSVDYIYEFCPLPNPDVGPSIFVCDVEHTSFHFGLCGRKFVLCLFGQCQGLCTIRHSWQHTGVVHLSLQADGKVAFEDIPVFGVCRPACHHSSLYLFVLVLFLEAVVLSQVHVAWDIFYQHIVHVYRGVVYNHHLCLCDVHLKTHLSSWWRK